MRSTPTDIAVRVQPKPQLASLPSLIAAIGHGSFGGRLLAFYADIVALRALVVFRMSSGDKPLIAAGESLAELRLCPEFEGNGHVSALGREGGLVRLDLPAGAERFELVLALRDERASLRPAQNEGLRMTAMHVSAALSSHAQTFQRLPAPYTALQSLDEIETCLSRMEGDLSPRESAVCSRIIFGMTTYGIAVNLGIGEESVSTYRKRAYRRLGIACQRELLMIYLRWWHDQKQGFQPPLALSA